MPSSPPPLAAATATVSVEVAANGVASVLAGVANLATALKQGEGAEGTSNGEEVEKGPPPNGGDGPQHGGTVHNDAIDAEVQRLQGDDSVSNIRKNQQQVDVNGNKVGINRPDLQYDQGGVHHVVEFDTIPSNGIRHAQVIRGNDPDANIRLVTP